MAKKKATMQLRYLENNFATLQVVFELGPMAKPKPVIPGDVIFQGKTVKAEHCGGNKKQAAKLNLWFEKLRAEGRAVWEPVPDDGLQEELDAMNSGEETDTQEPDPEETDGNDNTDTGAGKD